MAADIVWTSRATKQFGSLTDAQQSDVGQMIEDWLSHCLDAHFDYMRRVPNHKPRKTEIVQALSRLTYKIRFTLQGDSNQHGWFQIEEVFFFASRA
ncbi:MAG: hypothetical protein AAGF95_24895 [Chloroflexota bacterium]